TGARLRLSFSSFSATRAPTWGGRRRDPDGAGQLISWGTRAAHHLLGRLDQDGSACSLPIQPGQKLFEMRRRDRVGVALQADVVEHELHPAATGVLGVGDVA